jgi:TIR domain-containing protein/SH3 domain-containing protein
MKTGRIFINYRRGDDPGYTGRLFDRLQEVFAPEQLFLDVDNIAPGLDFVRVLDERIAESDVVLAVIGKGWIDARDAAGARRLDNADDFVRVEIASALNQDKRVIPVLVGEAAMPRPEELPEVLRPLARRNAVRLTHERFRSDMQGLIKAIQQALEEKADAGRHVQAAPAGQLGPPAKSSRFRTAGIIAVGAVVLVAGAILFEVDRAFPPSSPNTALPAPSPSPATASPAPLSSEALAPPSPAKGQTNPTLETRAVKRGVSLGYLNLRAGPGQDDKVLTRIPAGTTGIVMKGACVMPIDSNSTYPFCFVEWNGQRGWVSSNGLE